MLIFLDKAPSHCMGNFQVHDQDYHNTCTFFNSIYHNIRAYTISFKEIPASSCRNLLTLFNQRMEYLHGHKTEQQTCKETQPTPGSKHQRLHWPTSMGQSEKLFSIQHSVGHWYKSCEHAQTNTTQLLQIAATDELPYRNETGLA